MARKALLLVALGGSLLTATRAWADDVGYIDCASHPDNTQVLAKAAKTDETVASLPCGERFVVLVNGFFFSRIQTSEGKVGYVLTNSISHDTSVTSLTHDSSATSVANAKPLPPLAPARAARSGNPFAAIAEALRPKQQQGLRVPGPPTSVPTPAAEQTVSDRAAVQANTTVAAPAAQATPAPATQSVTAAHAPVANANFSDKSAVIVESDPSSAPHTPSTASTIASSQPPSKPAPAVSSTTGAQTQAAGPQDASSSALFPAKSSVIVQTESGTDAQRRAKELAAEAALEKATAAESTAATAAPAPSATKQTDSATTQSAAVTASANTPSFPARSAVIVQPETRTSASPEPSTAAQPEPTPAQPEPASIQPASFRSAGRAGVLGNGIPSGRTQPLIELFGGFAFARMDNGAGSFNNFNGALGSFGWNAKPWLQVVADTSYNMVTTNGVKNVLYGNHYGPRFFLRGRHHWGATPFVEGLIGGSRIDTTVSGTGGYTASTNCISIKAGGGLDLKPSRHLELRLIDVDYYRTAFGTNVQQSNYWVSAGIVLRLFGGGSE